MLGSLTACISHGCDVIAARREPGHLAFVVLALGLPAHDEHAMAVAEEVGIERRLVAGAMPDLVLGPMARLALGVFVPERRHSRKTDHDLIDPAIAVDVVRPAGHALAIAVQAIAVIARLANVLLAPAWCFIPRVADQDVELAVLVHVADPHSLRAELALDDRFLPGDRAVGFARGKAGGRGQKGQQAKADVVKIRMSMFVRPSGIRGRLKTAILSRRHHRKQ